MKSCIQWRKGFKYLSQIDEFNIDYKNKEIKLVNFLEHYAKTQRVNIRLPKDYTKDDIDLLEAIFENESHFYEPKSLINFKTRKFEADIFGAISAPDED